MNKVFIIGLIFYGIFYNNFLYSQEIYFSNLQWLDGGNEIQEAHIDDTVIIKFKAINIPGNEIINIEIWEQTDTKLMDLIKKLEGTVKDGIVEIKWAVEFDMDNERANYYREIEEKDYAIIDYAFVIKYNNQNIRSNSLAILGKLDVLVIDANTGEPMRNRDFMFYSPDGKFLIGKTDNEGHAKMRNLRKIGKYNLIT